MQTLDAILAQLCDAPLDNVIVGGRGAEAISAGGTLAFDFGFELRQAIEKKRLLLFARLHHRFRDLDEFVFPGAQAWPQLLRKGQGKERHHAVAIDLDEPLHEAAGLPRSERQILDKNAAEAVAMNAEIGESACGAA